MNAYTRHDIEKALDQLNLDRGDTVLVRADLRYLGMFAPDARQAPAALFEALARRVDLTVGTVVVPTGSLSLCNTDQPFELQTTPSELGAFSEYVRTRDDAVRSFHPFFSYAAVGASARDICASVPRHAFGPRSVKDRLIERRAKMISLGAHPRFTCTTVHHAEFMAGVPYRYVKEFMHPVVRGGKTVFEPFYLYVYYRECNIKRDKNQKIWKDFSLYQQSLCGKNFFYLYDIYEFYNHCIALMQSDPYIWLNQEPEIRPYRR
ncbi:MAG: AAC(3) family N-acetyltransferase [Desulfovibrionaceae bacterium]|nr:AAC(3) family N-acetyltransferase [Desulfovibrionaceae bacterium]